MKNCNWYYFPLRAMIRLNLLNLEILIKWKMYHGYPFSTKVFPYKRYDKVTFDGSEMAVLTNKKWAEDAWRL